MRFFLFFVSILIVSCGIKEKKAEPPVISKIAVCGEASNKLISTLKGQSFSELENSLKEKIELNCVNSEGQFPLSVAVEQGVNRNLEQLLEKGADANFQNDKGESALHLAAKSGKLYLIQTLFLHRANLNIQDRTGKSPIHLTVQSGDLAGNKISP